MKKIIFAAILCALALSACNKDEGDARTMKQYLRARAGEARELLAQAVEGTEEGEYKDGAKAALQQAVDRADAIYWDRSATQIQVDDDYAALAQAMVAFGDRMWAYMSEMEVLISRSQTVLAGTQIGDGDGKIPSQGDKDVLSTAIASAGQFMDNNPDPTQRQLDAAMNALRLALYDFEGKIPGVMAIPVVNYSFEEPDPNAKVIDFSLIPGWEWGGWIDYLTPWTSIMNKQTGTYRQGHAWWMQNADAKGAIPHGVRILTTFVYSKPVWQLLDEGIHTNSRYTLTAQVARFANNTNATDAGNNKFRMQLVLFTGKTGDFNKIEVLKELVIENIHTYTQFAEAKLVFDVPAWHASTGKRMAITLNAYYKYPVLSSSDPNMTWVTNENDGAVVDKVQLTREKHISQ